MAQITRKVCDRCHTDDDVHEVAVVRKYHGAHPFAVDVCPACFEAWFAELRNIGHPVKQSNVRPPARMRETKLRPAQLG